MKNRLILALALKQSPYIAGLSETAPDELKNSREISKIANVINAARISGHSQLFITYIENSDESLETTINIIQGFADRVAWKTEKFNVEGNEIHGPRSLLVEIFYEKGDIS